MALTTISFHERPSGWAAARLCAMACCGAMVLAWSLCAAGQQAAPVALPAASPEAAQPAPTAPKGELPAPQTAQPGSETPQPAAAAPSGEQKPAEAPEPIPAKQGPLTKPATRDAQRGAHEESQAGGMTEDELKQLLVGKQLFLRGGYLDNSLTFDEHGRLISRSPVGSYTLCAVEIDKVRLSKHKVELEGLRYGLHFLGALPYEDPTKAVDRVRITPKKKTMKITIDREQVVKPKKKKEAKEEKKAAKRSKHRAGPLELPPEMSEDEQLQASIAAEPAAVRPADAKSMTTTLSPAHASQVLRDALDKIFAPGVDERLIASMLACWKLYYQAAAAKRDFVPADPAVQRQNTVDKKARLLSAFEPASNEYAQANAVAGMALYYAVIGPDGKPTEIAVGRPIGFGLDENAVESIRKARFEPAMKDGKPVPVLLDLVVQFRIFSKRTAAVGAPEPAGKTEPVLPGPYSVQH